MKKFYSLALVALAAGTLSASAQFKVSRNLDAVNENAAVSLKAEKIDLATAAEKKAGAVKIGAVSHRANTNIAADYFISALMNTQQGQIEIFEPFDITAGTEANSYSINNLLFEDAKTIKATYATVEEEGQTFETLTVPAGQTWFNNDGTDCLIVEAGYNAKTGGWAADETTDMTFLMLEEDGDFYIIPTWSFRDNNNNTYDGCIGWVFTNDTSRGNCFPDTEFIRSNATFSGTWAINETEGTEVSGPAFAMAGRSQGKDILLISGIYTDQYVLADLPLIVAEDGTATASNAESGLVFTLQDNSKADGYYWTPVQGATTPTVSALVTASTGHTTVTFENNVLALGILIDGSYQMARWWENPVININRNFDIAGVENIAADAELDLNAPVEYYNLQGMRVAQPEAGQLLIKRQGNKATKVVIR